ncbi:MAG: hypothetical protein J6T57_02340 [Alphaproteobacteria bacterium]|nr:hypothetical protein [Alphaproteobacteria bacterium]
MSDNGMLNNVITPADYVRITDKTWFVGNEETRKYHGEWLLCRDYIHTEEVAKTREKHPDVTAVHCMISESKQPFWGDDRLGNNQFDKVLQYRFDNPSVVPGIQQYMRVEFRNLYVTPWYWVGFNYVLPEYRQFEICYTINSLGDKCVGALRYNKDIEEMLEFFDGCALFDRQMKLWKDSIETRQRLLLNAAPVQKRV